MPSKLVLLGLLREFYIHRPKTMMGLDILHYIFNFYKILHFIYVLFFWQRYVSYSHCWQFFNSWNLFYFNHSTKFSKTRELPMITATDNVLKEYRETAVMSQRTCVYVEFWWVAKGHHPVCGTVRKFVDIVRLKMRMSR